MDRPVSWRTPTGPVVLVLVLVLVLVRFQAVRAKLPNYRHFLTYSLLPPPSW
jgi:hypothetical protein